MKKSGRLEAWIQKNVLHTIKGTYTLYLVMGVLLASLLVGGSSSFLMYRHVSVDAAHTMNLHCHGEAQVVNEALSSTERSVKFMQQYAQRLEPDINRLLSDKKTRKQYDRKIRQMFESIAIETRGAVSYYLRYNPEYFTPTDGFLFSKEYNHESLSKGYKRMELTDLSLFSPDDDAVSWFYIPVEQGYGAWISPYWGDNLQMNMISYVEPLYVSGKIIGIVGMDVDFDRVLNRVSQGKLYDGGYAFLIGNNGKVINSKYVNERDALGIGMDEVERFSDSLKKFSSGERVISYHYDNVEKWMVYYTLNNAMKLVLVADKREIFLDWDLLVFVCMLAAMLVAVVLALIGYRFTRRLTGPIEQLSDVALQVGTGDLKVTIPGVERPDEVGNLARAFHNTTVHIQQYVDYVQNLAYKDALTDVQNKAAYDMSMEQMDVDIRMGRARFALIMVDLNYLKRINDTYGHEIGNRYILNLCAKITDIFAVEMVYRIGGDEFIVLVKEEDYERREELLARLRESLAFKEERTDEPWENVSAATGMAEFDPDRDDGTDEVFKRADEEMYRNKMDMKAARS